MVTRFAYTTFVRGQPTGLSKEACLHAGADWLSSTVSQRVVRDQLLRIPFLTKLGMSVS